MPMKPEFTLDEVIKLATQIDLEFASWRRFHGNEQSLINEENPNKLNKNKNFPQKRIAHFEAQGASGSKQGKFNKQDKRNIKCFNCNKTGHMKNECRNRPKQNKKLECTYCHRPNHTFQRCFLKNRHEKERESHRTVGEIKNENIKDENIKELTKNSNWDQQVRELLAKSSEKSLKKELSSKLEGTNEEEKSHQ